MADNPILKDLFGTVIRAGQTVAMVQPDYKDLRFGYVMSVTPQKLWVRWTDHNSTQHEMLREPNQVIVQPTPRHRLGSHRLHDEVLSDLEVLKRRVVDKLSLIDAGETHGERLNEDHLCKTQQQLEEIIEKVKDLDMSYAEE